MNITEFVSARLDEDQAAAEAAPGRNWRSFADDDLAGAAVYDEQWRLLDPVRYGHDKAVSALPEATGPQYVERARNALVGHIARHGPARVLREVAAKRKILALHRPDLTEYVDADGDDRSSLDCLTCETGGVPDSWPCPTLRLLAAVWSDHPDYQPGWAPQ